MSARYALSIWVVLIAACASVPQTHHYALVPAESEITNSDRSESVVLAVELLEADAAYDDQRIAYRPSTYRLEYYNYHRWSADPSRLVGDFLRTAYARTGLFRRVTRSLDARTTVSLSGRVTAFEEVDESKDRWLARVRLELSLREPGAEIIWSKSVAEQEPLEEQSPAGLAAAMSRALERIVQRTAPEIIQAARSLASDREPAAHVKDVTHPKRPREALDSAPKAERELRGGR